ncbi:hypothetical protein [Methylobacterium aerolatum]|uniref:Uncharacterized protein n=1 Tax=Methylobacterium aerolatum TaxID=418708 RepID=A0ABU0HUW6_9HYPH|nr:hypothetical protein [Methylobacterium aerolatum]MDQ0446120.1 hypothetical protein [Methylobacterium aerolatum]GJD35156.1 hypothetical protein FMGBMHLM_2064 [Methylobacterium aerolatum]
MTARLLAGALVGLSLTTGAFAQSFTAPAGIPAVTAPGGVQGRAAVPNLIDSRNVDGYVVIRDDAVDATGSIPHGHGGRIVRTR